jgi:hypothetical protein
MVNKVKKQECLGYVASLEDLIRQLYESDMVMTTEAFNEDYNNAQCILMMIKSIIEEEQHD